MPPTIRELLKFERRVLEWLYYTILYYTAVHCCGACGYRCVYLHRGNTSVALWESTLTPIVMVLLGGRGLSTGDSVETWCTRAPPYSNVICNSYSFT